MWHRVLVLVFALVPLASSAQVVIPDTPAGRTDPQRVASSFMRVVPPSVTATPNFGIDVATRDLV